MKKQLLFVFLLFGCLHAYAQINLTNVTLQYFTTDNTVPIDAVFTVENNNPDSVDINVIRTIDVLAPFHEEAFCFGLYCYLPGTDTSLFTTTVYGDSTDDTFKAHIDPMGYDGTDRIHYCLYDVNNPADSASVTIAFIFNVTGINENNDAAYLKFNNAVNNFALLSYHLPTGVKNSRIDFYNMLGSKLKTVSLDEKQGARVVTTSELANGIYLLSFIVDNKVSHSYKMVVNHNKGN